MYESSLNSLYVITLIGFALFTILGSAARKPDTSVQFSYTSALLACATIEPVTSEPPLEKVFTLPSLPKPGTTALSILANFASHTALVFSESNSPSLSKQITVAASMNSYPR